MEPMASRTAKRFKDQEGQGSQIALMKRKSVRTVCINALGVDRKVTAKQIAEHWVLLLMVLLLFLVKRGPSVFLALMEQHLLRG